MISSPHPPPSTLTITATTPPTTPPAPALIVEFLFSRNLRCSNSVRTPVLTLLLPPLRLLKLRTLSVAPYGQSHSGGTSHLRPVVLPRSSPPASPPAPGSGPIAPPGPRSLCGGGVALPLLCDTKVYSMSHKICCGSWVSHKFRCGSWLP